MNNSENQNKCVVCFETCSDSDKLYVLCCKQMFHLNCVLELISNTHKCPICKKYYDQNIPYCLNNIKYYEQKLEKPFLKKNIRVQNYSDYLDDVTERNQMNRRTPRVCHCPSILPCTCNFRNV